MTNDTTRPVTFDGITLPAERVCDDPDGYDRITAWDPTPGNAWSRSAGIATRGGWA